MYRKTIQTTILSLALAMSVSGHAGQTERKTWEEEILFSPSEEVLHAEQRGRVWILSGLDEQALDRAMDEQYERLAHLMFVNVRGADPKNADEDECD